MHEQLIEEKILPSMQPEPVLSQAQIEELGLHKKTFDQIMNEIRKTNSSKSVDSAELGLITDQPPLSQHSAPHSAAHTSRLSTAEIINDSAPISPKDSLPAERVNPIVAKMMKGSTQARTPFVEPLCATAAVPLAPKTFKTLFGSLYNDADKERFKELGVLEVERGEERYGLQQPPAPVHHIGLDRPYEGSLGKEVGTLAPLTASPRTIKTTEQAGRKQ